MRALLWLIRKLEWVSGRCLVCGGYRPWHVAGCATEIFIRELSEGTDG